MKWTNIVEFKFNKDNKDELFELLKEVDKMKEQYMLGKEFKVELIYNDNDVIATLSIDTDLHRIIESVVNERKEELILEGYSDRRIYKQEVELKKKYCIIVNQFKLWKFDFSQLVKFIKEYRESENFDADTYDCLKDLETEIAYEILFYEDEFKTGTKSENEQIAKDLLF